MRLCVIRGKPSCSNGSYISHPLKVFFFLPERHRKAKRNPLGIFRNISEYFLYSLYFMTRLLVRYLPLPDLSLFLFLFYVLLSFFFQTVFLEAVEFLDIFSIQRNMIEGRIKSLFVDLLLLIHTGLNLQTIIAIYGKKTPSSLSNGQSKEFYLLFRTVPTDARCKI